MNNLRISTRLLLLIGGLCMLLIAFGGFGLYGISRANEGLRTVYEDRTVPMGQIAEIQELLLGNRLHLATATLDPRPEIIARETAAVEANIATIGRTWSAYMATEQTAEEKQLARKFADDRGQFVQQALQPTMVALRANDITQAQQLMAQKLDPLYAPVAKEINALFDLQLSVAKEEYGAAVGRYQAMRAGGIASMLAGLALAAVFGALLIRGISRPLNEAVQACDAIARGDLSASIQPTGRDEVASLLRSLAAMRDNLSRVVADVRANAESVATASAQIAQGNSDLSGRTEEQASALQQTAATMEQLGSTVRLNADNARQANQMALGASTVATRGGEVVGQVVETMKEINDRSKKIADIIGVIDSIAFQTNILALNAAVEAARAGEQGRGFAVVAAEVRNLAQRSAEAAREIKSLISASVERVEQGTLLVDRAGETMKEIVGAIQRVNDIMGEISAASTEQSTGVGQVGEAVSQMDQATQQNAALVEESAAAADSLKGQAQQLVQVVAVFTLAHDQRHDASPALAA